MYIFIGFSENNNIIIEARDELNKLEKGIFFRLENKLNQSVIIPKNQSLEFFDFSDYSLIDHFNASLFDELFSLELNELVHKILFFLKLVKYSQVDRSLKILFF